MHISAKMTFLRRSITASHYQNDLFKGYANSYRAWTPMIKSSLLNNEGPEGLWHAAYLIKYW